jgi:hypothetical protein
VTTKNFPALEWLAAMCSHIPNRGEQMVRYYGYCDMFGCGGCVQACTRGDHFWISSELAAG